ncbi:hypothetical protein LR002_01030 [Candidatus Gracilibacteria bacterium]|nr:hypothetical protein [Candidatus Gracilibacteria bacterium]
MQALTPGEKHTPVIEITGNKVKVIVPNHPAQSEEHFISNITLFKDGEILISKDLTFKDEAVLETEIEIPENGELDIYATEYCNLHGKWDSEGKMFGM